GGCRSGGTFAPSGDIGLPVECTDSTYCDPHWIYGVYSNKPNDIKIFDRWQVRNSTGKTISATFKADTGGTVTHHASITLSAEASAAVFGKVSASVNAGVQTSMTASTGVSATSNVNPYSTLYGDYGVWREQVRMKKYYMYSNCNTSAIEYFDYYAPYRKGWNIHY
ncbi:hypothetical protein ACNAW0_14400, partial [Micromonospora sp. SL1-18]|uniref:hypothetical protein n=1 Tax=Micromonospora sp. SL1-18 TaxID=3399128 RepID=UPI003A4D4D34